MSGQDWNTVLNRVLAVQAAEAEVLRVTERLEAARVSLNDAIKRDEFVWDSDVAFLAFVVGDREFTVRVPHALRGAADVRERPLNVITLNK